MGINFGLTDFHIRDDHASPLFFRGVGIAPSIQYLYKAESAIHMVELSYYSGYLGSTNSNFNTNNYRGKIKYSYVHSIIDFNVLNHALKFFAGASGSTFLSLSDYRYLGDNLAIKSWYWNHSLNVELELIYIFDQKEYISTQFSVPVISNISRPKYSPSENYSYSTNSYKVDTFGEMKFFPGNFFASAILTYHTSLSDRFSLQLEYEFFYSLYNKPQKIDMFMNNIRGGLYWGF